MEVIANTTVTSIFASVGRLDISQGLLSKVHISTEVFAEIQDGQAEDATFYEGIEAHISPFSSEGWLRQTTSTGVEELSQPVTSPCSPDAQPLYGSHDSTGVLADAVILPQAEPATVRSYITR
jgi:hypothetical protein